MRGRLQFKFLAEIASLETAATEAAVATDAGYDPDFREPVHVDDGSLVGVSSRVETTRFLEVQVEPAQWDKMHKVAAGDARDSGIMLVAHFKQLEAEGWVNDDGSTVFKVNDRLVAIREVSPGNPIVLAIPVSPGLYLRESMPIGFGFSRKRNLLQLDFKARVQARN